MFVFFDLSYDCSIFSKQQQYCSKFPFVVLAIHLATSSLGDFEVKFKSY